MQWILGGGGYEQFVANRLRKTREHVEATWEHVPTENNPKHRASRDQLVSKENQLWWKKSEWLGDPRKWPKKPCRPTQ